MRFEVLGPLHAWGDQGAVALARGQSSAALAWLLMNAGDVTTVDSLMSVLWESPPATAAAKTKSIVRDLAAALAPGTIELLSGGARISTDHDIDARHFATLVASGRRAMVDGDRELARADLERALKLWHGDPYPDLKNALAAAPEIQRLIDLQLSAVEDVNGLALQSPVAYPLVAELRAQVTVHPERTRLWCQLALALYRVDRQVEALETLRQIRSESDDADGRIRRLESAILQNAPELGLGELDVTVL